VKLNQLTLATSSKAVTNKT